MKISTFGGMVNEFIKMFFLLTAFVAIASCSDNLFGSGSSGNDVKSLRIDAENAFRRGDYKGAYKISEKIVKIDPKVSFGHFGMAKAALWMQGINPIEAYSYFENLEDENSNRLIPFMHDTIRAVTQNKYFQGMKSVASALAELDRRDSLTVLYEFHKRDSINRVKEGKGFDTMFVLKISEDGNEKTVYLSLNERLEIFRKSFCNNSPIGACSDTTSKKEKFPLSDREYNYEYYGNILLMTYTATVLLELLDINSDGCITKMGEKGKDYPGDPKKYTEEWVTWGCSKNASGTYETDPVLSLKFDENGNFIIDANKYFQSLGLTEEYFNNLAANPSSPLPSGILDLNNKVDNFTGNLDEVTNMMNFLGIQGGSESGDLQGDIEKYKDHAVFFRVGTHIDEDGDGCIDEDLLDGQDNDGDGLKNGNARVASTDPKSPIWGKSGINHSMYGGPENYNDSKNLPIQLDAPVYIRNYPGINCSIAPGECTELLGNEEGKVTVIGFTQESGYWTSNNAELKLQIAKDTICPPKYKLAERKTIIGGCWQNYDEAKFLKYWLQRGLARQEDQERRIHPSCKNYSDLSKL